MLDFRVQWTEFLSAAPSNGKARGMRTMRGILEVSTVQDRVLHAPSLIRPGGRSYPGHRSCHQWLRAEKEEGEELEASSWATRGGTESGNSGARRILRDESPGINLCFIT